MKNNLFSFLAATSTVAFVMLGSSPAMAGAHDKPGGSISASATRTATVTKIDAKDRWVTLKREDGTLFDIQAGPAVKNFAQIKVGDLLVASEQDTVTIEVLPAGKAAPNVTGGTALVGAPAGSKPMGVMVDTTVITGAVTAIDYAKRTVTLQGPEGNSRTFEVGPGAKKFDAVKKGDNVVVTLKVSTTLEITAPPKK